MHERSMEDLPEDSTRVVTAKVSCLQLTENEMNRN